MLATAAVASIAAVSGLGCKEETTTQPSAAKRPPLKEAPSATAHAQPTPSNATPSNAAPSNANPSNANPSNAAPSTTAVPPVHPAVSLESPEHRAIAAACTPDEQVFFSCKTKSAGKIVVLCGSKHISKSEGYLQYRFGRSGAVELEFPVGRNESTRQFKYSHYFRFQVDRSAISFARGGFTYSIFENYEGDMGPATKQYGVEVAGPGDPPKTTTIDCEGKVVSRLSALRGIVPCDKSDPTNDCP